MNWVNQISVRNASIYGMNHLLLAECNSRCQYKIIDMSPWPYLFRWAPQNIHVEKISDNHDDHDDEKRRKRKWEVCMLMVWKCSAPWSKMSLKIQAKFGWTSWHIAALLRLDRGKYKSRAIISKSEIILGEELTRSGSWQLFVEFFCILSDRWVHSLNNWWKCMTRDVISWVLLSHDE